MVVGSPTKLNLIPSGVMPVVYINQSDAGYDKEFLVYNGDSPYNVPAGVSATIRGKKADGYGVTEAAALTEGSNLVTVTITEQMVAAAGANLYELVFVDTDGLRIATINMVWAVKPDALGDSVISDSDLDYATTVMDTLQGVMAFKSQVDANRASIAAETAARIEADNTENAARAAADTAIRNSISAEASTRANQDTSLQAQINQLVAPTGSAPSAAEVQNARIGVDGVTYNTLGDAIRTQVTNLNIEIVNGIGDETTSSAWVQGSINYSTGAANTYNTRMKMTVDDSVLYVRSIGGYKIYACVFTDDGFAGTWNGETCQTGVQNDTTFINIRKLFETMNPKTVWINMQNAGNTVINQTEAPTKVLYMTPVYVYKDEYQNKIADIESIITTEDQTAWEQGGINSSTGAFSTLSYRIRKIIDMKYVHNISAATGYEFGIFAFNGSTYVGMWNGTSFGTTAGWVSEMNRAEIDSFYNSAYTFWIVAGTTTTSSVTPSDGENIGIYIDNITELKSEVVGIPRSNPNILWQCRPSTNGVVPPESKWYVKYAWDNQYDRVRFNVRKTTDGYYFLCHDNTINNVARNPDGTTISESVSADGKTLAELNAYDWGIRYGAEYAGATVPMFEDSLKVAAAFNLGVTIELHWYMTRQDCENIVAICSKYGMLNNLIIACINGYNLTEMQTYKSLSQKISFYVGGTLQNLTDRLADINTLKTGLNKIYLQPYPIGTVTDESYRAIATANDLDLYCSWVFSKADFVNIGVDHGYTLMEIENIPMIKDYAASYAESLI